MDTLILFFVSLGFLYIFISLYVRRRKTFSDEINNELQKINFQFKQSLTPKLLEKTPFKSKLIIGKVQINDGAVRYDRTYFRKVFFKNEIGNEFMTWAKICTHWFKETQVSFDPELSEFIGK